MRICYLSDAKSEHTVKWCEFFKKQGMEIDVISLRDGKIEGVKVHSLEIDESIAKSNGSKKKLNYLAKIKKIQNIVKDIKPDILHAHYASSYGLLGALCNYHPYIISVWGSDILLFPKEGFIQKNILKYNFRKADYIFSTSRYMAKEGELYTNKRMFITPFGIDLNLFYNKNIRSSNEFKIVIAKSLEEIYGIGYLIKATKKLIDKHPNRKIKLIIAGEGTKKEELKNLASALAINTNVEFIGKIPLTDVAQLYNEGNVAVFPSLSESFGVGVLEAQACGLPVIVSDIDAFNETTLINETSFVCKIKDSESIFNLLDRLINDYKLMNEMGKKAEKFVKENFQLEENYNYVKKIYSEILNSEQK